MYSNNNSNKHFARVYARSSPVDGMFGVLSAQRHRVVLHAQTGRFEPAGGPILPGRYLVPLSGQRQLLLFESRLHARGT